MPRINVEDKWFSDPRREKLKQKIGLIADAVALNMWRLAQDYYRLELIIPKDVYFECQHAKEFIEARLAEEREDGVYIKGSTELFDWLLLKKEAGKKGGQASAKRPRNKLGQLLPKQNPSKPKQTQASSSSSLSASAFSPIKTPRQETGFAVSKEICAKNPSLGASALADVGDSLQLEAFQASPALEKKVVINNVKTFYDAYQLKYGVKLKFTGKDIGILTRLEKSVGKERLSELIQVYLQMDTKWFETKHHDLVTFEQCLTEIQVAHGSGKTKKQRDEQKLSEYIFGSDNSELIGGEK